MPIYPEGLSLLSSDGPRLLSPGEDPLAPLAATQEVVSALQALDQHRHTSAATSSLYTGQRTVEIDRWPGWSLTCTKLATDEPVLTTCPGDVVMHMLSSGDPLEVSFYDVVGFPLDGDLPARLRLSPRGTVGFSPGDTVVVPGGPFAACISGGLRDARFLRLSQDARHPLVASFDPDSLTLRAVTFVNHGDTARHFFATLLQQVVLQPAGNAPDMELAPSVVSRFMETGLADDTHLFTKWKLAQLAARTDPGLARSFLTDLASSGKPNAAFMADAALSAIGSR